MSKITFRADDDLVRRLEEFDSSKSEVMREALRAYLDGTERETDVSPSPTGDTIDDALAARVDALIDERLDQRLRARGVPSGAQDVNVNITLEGATAEARESEVSDDTTEAKTRKTSGAYTGDDLQTQETSCSQCGENVDPDHVYCPNCGELVTQPACGECGEELRSDWAFCPGCGRRTPAADVLDRT